MIIQSLMPVEDIGRTTRKLRLSQFTIAIIGLGMLVGPLWWLNFVSAPEKPTALRGGAAVNNPGQCGG